MDRTMRTSTHETRIGRVTSLLLLFIRTASDLGHACRQMEEFLAFCRSRQSGSFADGRLLGAWIDEHTVTDLPQEMELRLPTNEVILLAVRETFSLQGVWAVTSIEPVHLETKPDMELSHDMVFDALFALAQGDTGRIGRYSPAFPRGTPKKQVRAEIRRLNTRYPLRIEQPIYYDPATSGLSLQNERLRH
ncbi:MAG: hypothetical protein ACYDBH_11710 [Acidobacteriaceae bacterium]